MLCAGDPTIPTKSLIKKFKSEETETIADEKSRKLDGFYLVSSVKSGTRYYLKQNFMAKIFILIGFPNVPVGNIHVTGAQSCRWSFIAHQSYTTMFSFFK